MDNVPPTPPPSYVPPGQPYQGQPYGTPPPQQRGWFSRNWLWFIPTGCLGLIAAIALFVFVIVSIVFGAIKSSDPYKTALARAQSNEQVQAALGTPVAAGFIVSGNINVSGDTGDADLKIPISGPKGKGTILVVGKKLGGVWDYSAMIVHTDPGGENIDISGTP